jgi:hypothetical protein
MITVRFPSGFSIQYNTGRFADRGSSFTDIYTKKDGVLIAQVPNDCCVVEWVTPCRMYNPIATDSDRVQAEVAMLSKEIRSLKRALAKKGNSK